MLSGRQSPAILIATKPKRMANYSALYTAVSLGHQLRMKLHPSSKSSPAKKFTHARATENQYGVRIALTGSQIEPITAGKLGAVCVRWIISVPGKAIFHTSSRLSGVSKELLIIVQYIEHLTSFCRVGGVIGETSFKFFLQFTGWTAAYCIFTLILISIVISEVRHQVRHLSYFLRFFFILVAQGLCSKTKSHPAKCFLPAFPLSFTKSKLISR